MRSNSLIERTVLRDSQSQGASIQLGWASSPRSQLLCRSGRTGWVRLNQRVVDIKREIDWEVSRPTQAGAYLSISCACIELALHMQCHGTVTRESGLKFFAMV